MVACIKTMFYSLLETLDEVTAKVILSQGEEYQSTTSDLAIAVAQIDTNGTVMEFYCF